MKDHHPFNPKHEQGFCRWCGQRLRPIYAGATERGLRDSAAHDASEYFCTARCAIRYANITIDKGVRWVRVLGAHDAPLPAIVR